MLEKCKGVVYPDTPAHSEHYIANGASGSAMVCAGLPKWSFIEKVISESKSDSQGQQAVLNNLVLQKFVYVT